MARSILVKKVSDFSRPAACLPGVQHSIGSYQSPRCVQAPAAHRLFSTTTQRKVIFTPDMRDEGLIGQLQGPGTDTIDKTVQVLTPAFVSDPKYSWFLNHVPESERQRKLETLFRAVCTQAALNNGLFIEAGNFGCAGIAMPPGSKLDNPKTLLQAGIIPAVWSLGLGTLKRAMHELPSNIQSFHERYLTGEERANHWYFFVMGTVARSRGQGLATSLFLHMKNRAKRQGVPMVFEATTDFNRDLYLKHGGKILGEFVVGKGQVDAKGRQKKGGEGLTFWPMILRQSD